MSRTARTFFIGSVVFTGVSIWGVHMIQVRERETMFAGVIRDEQRLQAKKQQRLRELEFEDQAKKRAYLESVQHVSNPVVEPRKVEPDQVPTSSEGMDFGCKTCDRP
ncbi:Pet117p [Sporobolomyces koalae]|uniref:Pet117p n=1 Tax=Sporobolomyces koalae TaxID=500713 RepID=UPI003174E6CF